MGGFNSVLNPGKNILIIKKSEFIAQIFGVSCEDEIDMILNRIRKEHYKATHICYAYILGINNEKKKYFDDNEPNGTAGKPILSVLEKNNLTYVIAVVIRYFGGIKLGASNLTRAYANAVNDCLDKTDIIRKEECSEILCRCEYNLYGKLQAFFKENNCVMADSVFKEKTEITLFVPTEKCGYILDCIKDISNGKCDVYIGKTKYITI